VKRNASSMTRIWAHLTKLQRWVGLGSDAGPSSDQGPISKLPRLQGRPTFVLQGDTEWEQTVGKPQRDGVDQGWNSRCFSCPSYVLLLSHHGTREKALLVLDHRKLNH
jgi:hypothetical protein